MLPHIIIYLIVSAAVSLTFYGAGKNMPGLSEEEKRNVPFACLILGLTWPALLLYCAYKTLTDGGDER